MSGLIWSALGQSIGNASATVGNYMMRDAEREDREEERRREREADRKWKEEQNDRRLAERQSPGGGSSGRELTDEEQAAAAGMSLPDYQRYWASIRTGDKSAFKEKQTIFRRDEGTLDGEGDQYSDAVSRQNSTLKQEDVYDYPPGFEREYQAKVAKLAEVRKQSAYRTAYDDVKKGERTDQEIRRSEDAIVNPQAAGVIGQGMAAGAGKDLVGGDSNVTRNKFTGETKTTDVGKSQIRENDAQARKADADATSNGREAKSKELQALQQERMSIDTDLKRATDMIKMLRKDTPKGWKDDVAALEEKVKGLEEYKSDLQARIKGFAQRESERTNGGKKPSAGDNGIVKSGDLPAPKTKAEFEKLPKGARYKAPDGTTRIK